MGTIAFQFKMEPRWRALLAAGVAALALSGCAAPQAQGQAQAQAEKPGAAAAQDDPAAQFGHGMALLATDRAQAAKALESAALQGHGDAAYHLGLLQDDPQRRVEWHSMAAAVGQLEAQYALGEAYLNGLGTAEEPAWGLSWFERAARAGNAKAQYAFGVAMALGLVGAPQRDEALVWLMLADQGGNADARLPLGVFKARTSAAAWARAQENAKAWVNESAEAAETRATTRYAQYALGRLGYDAGQADGVTGGRTDAAVAAFRRANKLGAGKLDGRALDALREKLAGLER